MPLTGFEPAVPASERLQTHALDGAATVIGVSRNTAYNSSLYFCTGSSCNESSLLLKLMKK